jgi:hypothetical protein
MFETRYRSRKMRTSKWRNLLWQQTLAQTHWRSSGASPLTFNPSATIGVGTTHIINPTFLGTPGPTTAFWTATGGLQAHDTGGAIPTFKNDLIIRGGRVGMTIVASDSITDDIGVTVYTCWAKNEANYSAIAANVTWGSNIDVSADFAEFGKVLSRKDYIINHLYPTTTLEHRLRVQKIDQNEYGTSQGQQIVFILVITNLTTASASPNINVVTYHDMSFSGDRDT